MATLNEIFTNIANAIRSKKGTTDKMTPANMPTEIESIETGNGSGGLVGYSGTLSINNDYNNEIFKIGLKEDGTITTTYNETDKYVCFIIYIYSRYYLSKSNNTEQQSIGESDYYFIRPTADNWSMLIGYDYDMGGSND